MEKKMSNEQDKFKHSKRLYRDETAIAKQTRIAKEYGIDVREPNRFNKHHPTNCGNPKCVMCANPRKVFKEKTVKEKSFEQKGLIPPWEC
jgi:hypothetical protein